MYIDREWFTVFDDNFDINEAKVIYRQLGFSGAESALKGYEHDFGPGSGQIWLDDLRCSGNESQLFDCDSNGLSFHNCEHNEDAALVCEYNKKNKKY